MNEGKTRGLRVMAIGAGALLPVLGVLCAGVLGGCKGSSGTIVVPDDSAARISEARRIALEAQRAQERGDKAQAMKLYAKSLEQSRDLYNVWNNLGLLLMEDKNYMDAAEMFKAASDLAPSDPKPLYNVGLLYDTAGHSERALEYYSKSLERDPRYLPSLRGATRSARLLQLADPVALDRVRTAMLIEKDPKWRNVFEREQLRIEGQIASERVLRAEMSTGRGPRMGEIKRQPAPEPEAPHDGGRGPEEVPSLEPVPVPMPRP